MGWMMHRLGTAKERWNPAAIVLSHASIAEPEQRDALRGQRLQRSPTQILGERFDQTFSIFANGK